MTYKEKAYNQDGYNMELRYERDVSPEGIQDIGGYKEKFVPPKTERRDYTEQPFYQNFNEEQKKAYQESQMNKGIYTPEQLDLAKSLTNQEQMRRYGRVITPTKDEENISSGYGINKQPISKKQLNNLKKEEEQRRKESTTISFVAGAETKIQPELVPKFQAAIKQQETANLLSTLDIISAGGVPEEYQALAPSYKIVDEYKGALKNIGEKYGIVGTVWFPTVSNLVVLGVEGGSKLLQKGQEARPRFFGKEYKTGIEIGGRERVITPYTKSEIESATGQAFKSLGGFVLSGVKGVPKIIYTTFRQRQKLRTGLDTQADIQAYERLPSSLKKQYPTYESYKQRLQTGGAITQKLDVRLKPTIEEKTAGYTLLGFGALGLLAPTIATAAGYTIVGGQAIKTVISPTPENIGTTVAFGTLAAAPTLLRKSIPLVKSILPKARVIQSEGKRAIIIRLKGLGTTPREFTYRTLSGKTQITILKGGTVIRPTRIYEGNYYQPRPVPTALLEQTSIRRLPLKEPTTLYRTDVMLPSENLNQFKRVYGFKKSGQALGLAIKRKETSLKKGMEVKPEKIYEFKTTRYVLDTKQSKSYSRPIADLSDKGYTMISSTEPEYIALNIVGERRYLMPRPKKTPPLLTYKGQYEATPRYIPATKILAPYEARYSRYEMVRKRIIGVGELSAKERRYIRKQIISYDIGGRSKLPPSADVLITRAIEARPSIPSLRTEKFFKRKEFMESQIEMVKKRALPISVLPSRLRRQVRKGIISIDLKGVKPKTAYDIVDFNIATRTATPSTRTLKFIKEGIYRKGIIEEAKLGLRPISSLPAKGRRQVRKELQRGLIIPKEPTKPVEIFIGKKPKKIFTMKDIIKVKPTEGETSTTSGGLILITKTETKKKLKDVIQIQKQATASESPYAFGGSQYAASMASFEQYPSGQRQKEFTLSSWEQRGKGLSDMLSGKISANAQRIKPLVLFRFKSAQAQAQVQQQAQVSFVSTKQAEATMQDVIQSQAQAQSQQQISILKSASAQAQAQARSQLSLQQKAIKQRLRLKEELIPTTTKIPRPKIKKSDEKQFEFIKKEKGYVLFLKKKLLKLKKGEYKGVGFEQVGTAMTLEEAKGLGIKMSRESLKRSFYIKQVGEVTRTPNRELVEIARRYGSQFRTAKRNKEVFVQKTQYAISSAQEKREISLAGQLARRNQKLKLLQQRKILLNKRVLQTQLKPKGVNKKIKWL